jgi:hypothetical protein
MSAKNLSAKEQSTRATFLDPLGIFGLQKRIAANDYGDKTAAVAQQQQALVNRMFGERRQYSGQAESLLRQAPHYSIPGQVYQYNDLMQGAGKELYNSMSGYADQLGKNDYTVEGQKAMENAAKAYQTSAGSLRDIMRKGTQESAAFAQKGFDRGVQDTESFVNFYRNLAGRQEMPGQKALESKLGRNYAETFKMLGQAGGGSASSLGAMVDAAANKSEALSDLGIQAAQYKASQEAQLGEALQRRQAVMADLYRNMEQGAMTRAGAMAGAEQTAGTMEATGQEGLANYALNRQGLQQDRIMNQANLMNQGITGRATMQGQGLMELATAKDQAFQMNQVMPWQTQMQYFMSQIGSLNPYAAQSDVYNSQLNNVNNLYSLFGKSSTGI